MSSESGQRLSMEELQRRNPPPYPVPPIIQAAQSQAAQKTKRDWEDLLTAVSALYRLESTNSDRLERLEAGVSAQEAQLRALTRQVGHQAQLEALARDVALLRAELKQAGRRREISISPPSLETAFSVLVWLILILLGTMVGMVALQTIWSGLSALWSAVRILIP